MNDGDRLAHHSRHVLKQSAPLASSVNLSQPVSKALCQAEWEVQGKTKDNKCVSQQLSMQESRLGYALCTALGLELAKYMQTINCHISGQLKLLHHTCMTYRVSTSA